VRRSAAGKIADYVLSAAGGLPDSHPTIIANSAVLGARRPPLWGEEESTGGRNASGTGSCLDEI
jgi:hypothetical protein